MSDILEITPGSSIATVEQETGLSKDLLRVWERRYGFPCPRRDTHGERVYAEEDVAKLRVVRRLMDQGMRPGKILGLPLQQLAELARRAPSAPRSALHDLALYLVKTRQTVELRAELAQALARDGLHRFVQETAAPLSALVGEAWMRGDIRIFEEHLFTEQLQGVLRGAISEVPSGQGSPRVLLTTLPTELHGLGLLMAEALLALEGAECVSLGTQTPIDDIAEAAQAKRAAVVALSFSGNFPAGPLSRNLQELRAALPSGIALWCGGAGAARVKHLPAGVKRLAGLHAIGPAVADWHISSGVRGWDG